MREALSYSSHQKTSEGHHGEKGRGNVGEERSECVQTSFPFCPAPTEVHRTVPLMFRVHLLSSTEILSPVKEEMEIKPSKLSVYPLPSMRPPLGE